MCSPEKVVIAKPLRFCLFEFLSMQLYEACRVLL